MADVKRHSEAIEWCTHTENPITGCLHGCLYCYARGMAERWGFKEGTVYHRVKQQTGIPFSPAVHMDKLGSLSIELLRAKKRRDIFLGSMADICTAANWIVFDKRPSDGEIEVINHCDSIWVQRLIRALARSRPRHTFYILTKNPANFLNNVWPVNVRLGTSVCSSYMAKGSVPILRRLKDVAIKWVSVEPLLDKGFDPKTLKGVEWVVVGAQTGRSAPEFGDKMDAVLRIWEWCAREGVPLFVKHNIRKLKPEIEWPVEIPKGCALNP